MDIMVAASSHSDSQTLPQSADDHQLAVLSEAQIDNVSGGIADVGSALRLALFIARNLGKALA